MDYSPWYTSLAILTSRYNGLYIVYGPLSISHTRRLIPQTIVHGPLSVGHTRR